MNSEFWLRANEPQITLDCDLLTTAEIPYAAAWYRKSSLSFGDATAAVQRQLRVGDINSDYPPHRKPEYIPKWHHRCGSGTVLRDLIAASACVAR